MFRLWHNLDAAGKTTVRTRLPRDPPALLWDYQDGYPAGIPVGMQRAVLGGPTRLGYRRRWPETGFDQD